MRFPSKTSRIRIALLAGHQHPEERHAAIYGLADTVAGELGAETIFLHSTVADPGRASAALRPRIGEGLLAPIDPEIHANDVAHFATTEPGRLDRFLDALAVHFGVTREVALARDEVREAVSVARWARAWAPSVVVSIGLEHGSFWALAICELLGVPRVAVLDDVSPGGLHRDLLPMHVAQAAVVVAANEHVADGLWRRFGDEVRGRIVRLDPAHADPRALAGALARALAAPRARDGIELGPRRAFASAPTPPAQGPGAHPFVVVGAERTGSNMLMSMLDSHAAFACANELFNPRLIAQDELPYLPKAAMPRADLLALRRRDPGALLAQLAGDGAAAGARWSGFKLLYGHALIDDRVTDALAGDPTLRVVHLLRRDRLARWTSMLRALSTDRWFGRAGEASPRIVLPIQQTANDFVFHELMEARTRAVFEAQPCLELEYEDLVDRLPECRRRLADFFGVDMEGLSARTEKTGPGSWQSAIANLDELRSAFAGTKWAGLIP